MEIQKEIIEDLNFQATRKIRSEYSSMKDVLIDGMRYEINKVERVEGVTLQHPFEFKDGNAIGRFVGDVFLSVNLEDGIISKRVKVERIYTIENYCIINS